MKKLILFFFFSFSFYLSAENYKADVKVLPVEIEGKENEFKVCLQIYKQSKHEDQLINSSNLRCRVNSPITITLENRDKDQVLSVVYLLEEKDGVLLSHVRISKNLETVFEASDEIKKGL